MELVNEYFQHEYRHYGQGLGELEEQIKGKECLKTFLAVLFGDTLGLTEPKNLLPAIERYLIHI